MPLSPVIDFHAHVIEPEVFNQTISHSVITGFGARPMPFPEPGSPNWGLLGGMVDPEIQIRDMDRKGIDMSVISTPTVIQGTWWAEPPLAAELDRRGNQRIADWVKRFPERFVGSFTLPMQDLGLALKELDYAISCLGLKVANVSSNTGGAYLGHPCFRPFWEAVRDHGVAVLIHPHGVADPHFQKFALWNGVGQPMEASLALASLIYEGIFESFPEVRVVIVHGGGYLPHYAARLDRNATAYPFSTQNIKRLPTEYLRCPYYDSCVYSPEVLEALIRRVGADRVVLGTDYPFGEADPIAEIRKCAAVGNSDLENIVSRTPLEILGMERSSARTAPAVP